MSKRRPTDIDNNLDDLDLMSDTAQSTPDDILYRNGNGVLSYNDKKYAVGLIWLTGQEFQDDGSVYKKARSISCDFYCTRSFIDQNGFGTIKLKHKMGMPSAAAMAADALIGEWHGVFIADNGWLYVAVHSDTIAPEGDLFFLSEEDAYNHFLIEATKYKWPKTYVPESWNVKTNDGEIELEKILDDIASTTLKPANSNAFFGSAANKNLILIILLIALGFFTILLISQSLISDLIPKKANVPTQALNISDALTIPPKEPVFEKDPIQVLLESTPLPSPSLLARACIENFDQLMISMPGWDINQMRCRGSLVEATWQKNVGTLETLRSSMSQFPFGISKTYSANGNFLASKIIAGTSNFNEPLILSSREDALININNRFNTIGNLRVRDIEAKLNKKSNSKQKDLLKENEKPLTLENLPSLSIAIATEVSPIEIRNSFNFPGLKFNLIEWNIKNGKWLYDMQVYLYPEDYKMPDN